MAIFTRDDGYQDQGPSILGVSIALMSLGFILVIVRLNYRLKSAGIRTDDWLILVAAVMSLGHTINDCISVIYNGYGKHEVDLTPAQKAAGAASGAALAFFITQILYKLSLMCTKLSICFLYRRLFGKQNKTFNIALWSMIGLIFNYYTAALLVTVFSCTPVSKAWLKTEPGTCINSVAFQYANAGFNILTDVIVMAFPIPIIRSLHLPLRQKVALCGVFAVGLIATATSIVRIFTLGATKGGDVTWAVSQSVLWSDAELNTSIICACLPMLRPPLQALFPRFFRSRSDQSGQNSGYGTGDKYGGHSRHRSRSRYSRQISDKSAGRAGVAMEPMGRGGQGGLPRSDKSSDDIPYFIDRDDDSAGILKQTNVTIIYEDHQDHEKAQGHHAPSRSAGRIPDRGDVLPRGVSNYPARAL